MDDHDQDRVKQSATLWLEGVKARFGRRQGSIPTANRTVTRKLHPAPQGNVIKLQQKQRGKRAASDGSRPLLFQAPHDLDIQVANLLAQGVAVQAQHMGGLDLVAPGRRQ